MVGLVIATHGHLADEMVHTAEQIVGKLAPVETCSIEPGSSPDDIHESIRAAVRRADVGEGVVVLADLIGGTPCNQSLSLCNQLALEVVTGVNLPMLLKAHALRSQGVALPDLAMTLTQYGQKNITCPTAMLRAQALARSH